MKEIFLERAKFKNLIYDIYITHSLVINTSYANSYSFSPNRSR
jgi:hypothetical protein